MFCENIEKHFCRHIVTFPCCSQKGIQIWCSENVFGKYLVEYFFGGFKQAAETFLEQLETSFNNILLKILF